MRKEVVVYTQQHTHIGADRSFVGLRPKEEMWIDRSFPHKIPAMLIAATIARKEKCKIAIREERWDQINEPHRYVLVPDTTQQITAEAALKWVEGEVEREAENIRTYQEKMGG